MELNYNYQTLEQFTKSPFGMGYQPSLADYAKKYEELDKRQMIKFGGVLIVDGIYFIKIRVASESTANVWYDVVVQFFQDDSLKKRNLALNAYYVKFFSNSPGFVYKYGYLYHQYDMLIEVLAQKLPDKVLTQEPSKTNAEKRMGFDKTVYYACRYILDRPRTLMSKAGLSVIQAKSSSQFFEGVSDFEGIEDDISMSKIEASIRKEAKKDQDALRKKKIERQEGIVDSVKKFFVPKKTATRSTTRVSSSVKASGVKPKKKAGRTTRKKS